jgi:hypothetical protein
VVVNELDSLVTVEDLDRERETILQVALVLELGLEGRVLSSLKQGCVTTMKARPSRRSSRCCSARYCKQAWWLERVIHTAMDDTASIDSLSSDFASQQKRTFALCNSRLALASNAREGS